MKKKIYNFILLERGEGRRKAMASFSDYIKEFEQSKDKAREDLDEQIWILKDNIDLRIEELKCAKEYFKLYDYLYIMICLRSARNKLSEAQDIISGWTPVNEEDIPEDEIFKGEDNDED